MARARPPFTIDETIAMLEEHPKRIAAATKGIPAARLRRDKILGVWTATDVLAHMRCCEDARGDFIPLMLASRKPTLRAIDPRGLLERVDYRELDFATSLRTWQRQRARLLKLLRSLPRASWQRTAIVTGGGVARERTVLFYAAWLARHEPAHVRHIEKWAETVSRAR